MIICQPSKPVVYLISSLLGAAYFLAGMWMYQIFTASAPSLVSLFMVCLVIALLLFLTIRLATGYISIRAENNKLTVQYKLLGKTRTYALASLTAVDEVKINTFQNKEHKQLILSFGEEKISLNNQVYSGYDSLKSYVNQKKTINKNRNSRR